MRFIMTHPMHTHPYNPELVTGPAIAAVASAAEFVRHGDGWCPFAAQPILARVTNTATMDADDSLAAGIEDLRRRCDAAGRDGAAIDITYNGLPGDGLGHAREAIEEFGETVISAHSGGEN